MGVLFIAKTIGLSCFIIVKRKTSFTCQIWLYPIEMKTYKNNRTYYETSVSVRQIAHGIGSGGKTNAFGWHAANTFVGESKGLQVEKWILDLMGRHVFYVVAITRM
jgi:hypothetical protein